MVTNEADGDPIAGPDRLNDPRAHAGPAFVGAGGVEGTEDRICGRGRNIRSIVPATLSAFITTRSWLLVASGSAQ
jgi:hypothetical protein